MTTHYGSGPALGAILAAHDTPGPEYAVVECIDCEAMARIDGSVGRTDADLTSAFMALGWSVLPTRCPEHRPPIPSLSSNAPSTTGHRPLPCPVVPR